MKSFWRVSAAALIALGLAMPLAGTASSASMRSGPFVGVGPNPGGGAGFRGGAFGGVGPRSGGMSTAPRSFNMPSSGPKFSPGFKGDFRGKGNWSGKGDWSGKGNWSGKGPGGKPWNGKGNWNGKGDWSGKGHHHHRHHRHRYYPGFYGYAWPYYDDYYYYGYDGNCAWLWRRWLQTGNPKWKYRYYECIE
ncbi:MAG TPA: hypothetical protein PKD49_02650 [Hyphomicrobium sp.]|nr:hypothetical protein [Hyphomicrobium sp.]